MPSHKRLIYKPISQAAVKRIKKLASEHEFKAEYDLVEKLNRIPTNLLSLNSAIKSVPRLAETKRQISNLRIKTRCFLNRWKKINDNTKSVLNEILIKHVKHGYKNINLNKSNWSVLDYEELSICVNNISSYLGTNTSLKFKDKEKKQVLELYNKFYPQFLAKLQGTNINTKLYLNDIIEQNFINITAIDPNWSIYDYEKYSKFFYEICQTTLSKVAKDKGGSQPVSILKNMMLFLASIYHEGTDRAPTCGWDEFNEAYVGGFFEFLYEIIPLLEKEFRLNLSDSYSVIGKYAAEVLKNYRNKFMFTAL